MNCSNFYDSTTYCLDTHAVTHSWLICKTVTVN